MKAVILAAGLGSRLSELTKTKPKCMVEYKKIPLINYQISALQNNAIDKIAVIGGYKSEVLKAYLDKNFKGIEFFENKNFASTNMVATLFCAKEFWLDSDVIISYSDIIYDSNAVLELLKAESDFKILVDKNWLGLWSKRFKDPLSDAESLKINTHGNIIELGKKVKSIDEIQAQYMGLFAFSKGFSKIVVSLYDKMNKAIIYDGKDFANMYMTSFLQHLIDSGYNAKAVFAPSKWLEIDTKSDLDIDI